MASLSVSASYTDGFYVYFNDLGYSAKEYTYFYVEIYNSSNSYIGSTTTYYSSSTSKSFTTRITSSLFRPSTSYYLLGKVKHTATGKTFDVGSKIYATTASLPQPPPAPSNVTNWSPTPYSMYMSWSGSSNATSYYIYKDNVFQTSVSSIGYTFSNLIPSETRHFSVSAVNGNGESSRVGSYAKVASLPNPTGLYAPTIEHNKIGLYWTIPQYATSFNIYRNNSYIGYTTSNWYNSTNLSSSTSYTFAVKSLDGKGNESSGTTVTARTLAPPLPPPAPTVTSVTSTKNSVTIKWNTVSGADGYNVYLNTTNMVKLTSGYTSYTYSNLSSWTNYTPSVASTNSTTGLSSTNMGKQIRTLDGVAPTLNSIYGSGLIGNFYVHFSATDSQSGLSSYEIYVSSKDGSESTLKLVGTASASSVSYKIDYDGNGARITTGKYYIGVIAIDKDGNRTARKTNTWTIKEARPTPFSWSTTKTSKNKFALTAKEWNNFTSRINDFRKYKGLTNYSFTQASSGGIFYAYMYNQARTAINAMNPSTTVLTEKSSGSPILASDINRLVTSLNSVA